MKSLGSNTTDQGHLVHLPEGTPIPDVGASVCLGVSSAFL